MRIAIDVMGGDHGAESTMPAIAKILKHHPQVSIIAVGNETLIHEHSQKLGLYQHPRLSIVHCDQVVGMDESPLLALRNKRKSSMAMAISAVRQDEADGCVSAGNTGALVAISRYLLKTLPGIDRPAIITTIPTMKQPVHMVDLGANVDCDSSHLVQFAKMASVMVELVQGKKPSVGVLNIGVEAIKGNSVVKETIAALQATPSLKFVGSVEADTMFEGETDIVVCDGFVGNVALKVMEGTAKLVQFWLKDEIRKNWWRMATAALCFPIWRGLKQKFDPRLYNGATLLGLQGVVVKSHGGADAIAFGYAVEFAIRQIERGVNHHIIEKFSHETIPTTRESTLVA